MKRLSSLSLRTWAWIIALLWFALFTLQLLWLHTHYKRLMDVQLQLDIVREQQLLFTELQHTPLTDAVRQARISQLSRSLERLRSGGTLPLTGHTLPPLPKMPALTLAALLADWQMYAGSTDSLHQQAQALLVTAHFNVLVRDLQREAARQKKYFTYLLVANLGGTAILLLGLVWWFQRKVVLSLHTLAHNTALHQHTNGLPPNELGQVAKHINDVVENLRDASDFINAIREGNLNQDYRELEPDYVPGRNKLADALIAMQEKLRQINEEEQQRKWANEGLTRFVEILRSSQNNLQQLADRIISTLVQYTRSNQGALYALNDDDPANPVLELLSLYAFNIKKHQQQRIKPGEGLVGQTFLEKQTVYLRNLPEEYIRITSGLGDAPPGHLLIVPLKLEDKVYGVVELASFNAYQAHEILFVEKLGETLASTLASVRTNQQTQRLLEESRLATEAMRAQEEEMRQNMEELAATQEEMQRILQEAQRNETYLSNLMDATDNAFVAIDRSYKVAMRNNAPLFDQFIKAGIPYEKGFNVLSLFKAEELAYHKSLYDRVFDGETISVVKNYFGRNYSVNYKPLRAPGGEIVGAAIYAHDLTEQEKQEARIRELESRLAETPADATLTELEKTLRLNLEALTIALQAAKNTNE